MSLPRAVLPGRCYMITRRCSERRFFMRPDAETNNAFVYCLGYAAQRTRVQVVFFLAMSNHYHAGVIDSEGRLPEFLEQFHKLFAKHQNALRGRWENFWATEQTSAVELIGVEDVLDKMVYALGNPVKDHLVKQCRDWPGASSLDVHICGKSVHALRPRRFFRSDGPMPENLTLALVRPPGLESMPDDELRALLKDRLEALEQAKAVERGRQGLPVMGRKAVLRQRCFDRPSTREARRGLSPRVACKNTWRRIEALHRNKAFVGAYRTARERLLAGLEATLPVGTYWLRLFAGLPCESVIADAA
jgi:putative transposase